VVRFTASAIMTLVEDGKVELDAPIVQYLAGAPETWNGITVRHLLTHTSGLPELEEGFEALRSDGARLNYTTKKMLATAARHLFRLWMRDHGRRAYPG
jgi:CubicO group peptidase (beta-lactamase class C family)